MEVKNLISIKGCSINLFISSIESLREIHGDKKVNQLKINKFIKYLNKAEKIYINMDNKMVRL